MKKVARHEREVAERKEKAMKAIRELDLQVVDRRA